MAYEYNDEYMTKRHKKNLVKNEPTNAKAKIEWLVKRDRLEISSFSLVYVI